MHAYSHCEIRNIFLSEYFVFTRANMIEKVGTDILGKGLKSLNAIGNHRRIVSFQKIIGKWKWDVYKYSGKTIPYVRFFQGRRKIAEYPLTQVARTAIGAFLITTGVPSENIPQILKGIYNIFSVAVTRNTTYSQKKFRVPNSVKIV